MKGKILVVGVLFLLSNLFVNVFANDPPSIKNVKWSPENPNTHSTIRISATVTDDDGIAWVHLFYCFGGNCFPPVEMSGSNGKYSCQIGPFDEGLLQFHITAQDTQGNTADTPEYSVYIDGTPPEVRVISPNGNEIFSHKIKIEWDTSDNVDSYPDIEIKYSNNSGNRWYTLREFDDFAKKEYIWNVSGLPDGNKYMVKVISTDDAGNSEYDVSDDEFTIDNTPPFTDIYINGSKNREWFTSNVSISLLAIDNLSGVLYTKYKVDNDTWTNYTSPFYVTESGSHIIRYYSVDIARNKEKEKNLTFKIDKNVPSISILKPQKGKVYVFDREVMHSTFRKAIIIGKISIECTVSDELSGIERVEFYIDDELMFTDFSSPYGWEWNGPSFFFKEIKVVAYNNAGNSASDSVSAFTFIP